MLSFSRGQAAGAGTASPGPCRAGSLGVVPALSHRVRKSKDYRISSPQVPAEPELFMRAGSIIQDDGLASAVQVC